MQAEVKPTEQAWKNLESELTRLLASLIPGISDEYRASEDDDKPGMCVTVGVTPLDNGEIAWNYQTGDNSFTGGAYGHPVWGVGYLYRDSDPADVAKSIVDDAESQLW